MKEKFEGEIGQRPCGKSVVAVPKKSKIIGIYKFPDDCTKENVEPRDPVGVLLHPLPHQLCDLRKVNDLSTINNIMGRGRICFFS